MALPKSHRSDGELLAAEQRLLRLGLDALQPMTPEVSGQLYRVIHSSSWIEMHLRRCLDYLCVGGFSPEDRIVAGTLRIADLFLAVDDAVKAFPDWEQPQEVILERLLDIEAHRPYRNLFAHWAAALFEGRFVVFITRNESDAKKVLGRGLDAPGALVFCILKLQDIDDIGDTMSEQANWVSALVPQIAVPVVRHGRRAG